MCDSESAVFPVTPAVGGEGLLIGSFKSSTAFWRGAVGPVAKPFAKCFFNE